MKMLVDAYRSQKAPGMQLQRVVSLLRTKLWSSKRAVNDLSSWAPTVLLELKKFRKKGLINSL